MNTRIRNAQKRYRSRTDSTNYVTISLTLKKNVLDFLDDAISKTEEKNMSQFIEENTFDCDVIDTPKRRDFKSFPIKKTFTFTEDFVAKIKQSGNTSLFIETVLIEKFNIK